MFILKISNICFLKDINPIEMTFTNDYTKAKTYDKIGDAMKEAVTINEQFGHCIVTVRNLDI